MALNTPISTTTSGYSRSYRRRVAEQKSLLYRAVGRPSLDLAFAIDQTLDPLVTFTRASTATYFDSSGVLTSAAINTPRFDYNPSTLEARGLLIEEQRTNSIRNNTMVGAVVGTPGTVPTNWFISGLGTLTQEIVGVGTDAGVEYIDFRLSGTTSTTNTILLFDSTTQITAASGQSWASSFFVKLQSGSTTNITSVANEIRGYSSAGVIQEQSSNAITLTASLTRNPHVFALANAGSVRVINNVRFNFASGAAIDITLRIGMPQLELGAFATSVIPTTTTALTRSADVASVNTLSPWFNATEGTVFTDFILQNPPAINLGAVYAISNGTINERILVSMGTGAGGNINALVGTGGVVQAQTINGGISTAGAYRYANAYKVNDFASVVNGGASVTDASGNVPVVDRLILGANQVGNAGFLNGYLRRITYYPRRLSNAELQALTV